MSVISSGKFLDVPTDLDGYRLRESAAFISRDLALDNTDLLPNFARAVSATYYPDGIPAEWYSSSAVNVLNDSHRFAILVKTYVLEAEEEEE
jgi:hypothetical protein